MTAAGRMCVVMGWRPKTWIVRWKRWRAGGEGKWNAIRRLEFMKTLETTLTHSGYTLIQIWREGQIAVYSKQKPNMMQPHSYEVIQIQTRPAETTTRGGKVYEYPEREVYPCSEEWGTYGWTAMTLDEAHRMAREAVQREIPAILPV